MCGTVWGGAFAHPAGLTCGAFEQLFGTGDGNLTAKNRKIQMPVIGALHADRSLSLFLSLFLNQSRVWNVFIFQYRQMIIYRQNNFFSSGKLSCSVLVNYNVQQRPILTTLK